MRTVTLHVVLPFLWFASSRFAVAQNAASTPHHPPNHQAQTRIAIAQALPQMDGSHLNVTAVEVVYPPGGFSAPHSHPCPVIGYVIEGAVRMQVKGGVQSTYKAGEAFYEAANGVHLVSANASTSAPAKFIAYFVCDHETELSVPVRQDQQP